MLARNYGSTADPAGKAQADFGEGGGDWGATNWKAPKVQQALKTIASTADLAVRGQESNAAVFLVTHDHAIAEKWTDQIVRID